MFRVWGLGFQLGFGFIGPLGVSIGLAEGIWVVGFSVLGFRIGSWARSGRLGLGLV